ncbi:MAG: hypothetical protein AB7T63_11135 [Planctomycetota bacterium]
MDAKCLVGLLAVAGAAFAGGYVVGSGGAPTTPAQLAVGAEADHVEPQAPPGGELRASRPSLAPATAESALVPAALSEALAALPRLDVPPGDQTLDVVVRTDEGGPLPGVEIRVLPAVPKSLQWPEGTSVEQQSQAPVAVQVMYLLNAVRWRTEGLCVATTNGEGRCRFERMHDVEHTVTGELLGWSIEPPPGGSSAFRPGAPVELTAKPRSGILLDVRLPDGTVPEHATVLFRKSRRVRLKRWTAASPLVEVDPDTYELEVRAGEASELSSVSQSVTIERGATGTTLRVDLVERPTLRLLVSLDPTERVGMLTARWVRISAGSPLDARVLEQVGSPRILTGRLGATFKYAESGLQAGHYVLGVYRGSSKTPAHVQGVDIGPGLTDIEIQLPLPERSTYAVLRVQGPDGQPLSPLEFETRFQKKGWSGTSSGVPYIERPDGEYWVFHQYVDGSQEGGRFSITVEHRDLGSRVVTYAPGEVVDQEVRFDEPGIVDVSVPGVARYGLGERVRVWLGRPDARRREARLGRTVAGDGSARITHLQPGTYTARLLISYGEDDTLAIEAGEVDVRSGGQAIQLDLPSLHDVVFVGLGVRASLKRFAGEGNEYDSIAVGPITGRRAELTGLPAGRYELRTGLKTVPFTLPGPSLVRVE